MLHALTEMPCAPAEWPRSAPTAKTPVPWLNQEPGEPVQASNSTRSTARDAATAMSIRTIRGITAEPRPGGDHHPTPSGLIAAGRKSTRSRPMS